MTPPNQPQEQQANPGAAAPVPSQSGGTGGGSQPGGAGGGPSSSGSGSNDQGGDPSREIAERLALAEAMKPLESATADVYSADKQKSRDALNAAYDKAVGPEGDLRIKFDKANDSFDRAASDMVDRLVEWVKQLAPGGKIGKKLKNRKMVGDALAVLSGKHEKVRADTQATTKRWADRHADWSSPVDKMKGIIGEYADKIDKINADINNDVNRDAQILSFWFEVAPRHLQLTDKKLSTKAQQSLDAVKGALEGYSDLKKKLELGSTRNDGSLYLIPAGKLDETRRWVLGKWIAAAKSQATAEAAYKLDPDDAASRKQAWDKLKDDAWIKDARSALETPAA